MPFSEKTKTWIAIRDNVLLLELSKINPIEFLLWSQGRLKHYYVIRFYTIFFVYLGQKFEGSNSEIAVTEENGYSK